MAGAGSGKGRLRAGRFWRTKVDLVHLAIPVSLPLVMGALVWRFVLGPLGLMGELDLEESVVGLMARQLLTGACRANRAGPPKCRVTRSAIP